VCRTGWGLAYEYPILCLWVATGGLIYIVIMILYGCKRIFIISTVNATKKERKYTPWHTLPFLFYRIHSTFSWQIRWYKSVKHHLSTFCMSFCMFFFFFWKLSFYLWRILFVKINKKNIFFNISVISISVYMLNMFYFYLKSIDLDLTLDFISSLVFNSVIFFLVFLFF